MLDGLDRGSTTVQSVGKITAELETISRQG
jgi:hypothetical protein